MFPKVSAIVYDLEVERGPRPTNPADILTGIEYVDGWNSHREMGVACLCAYDCLTQRPLVFFKRDLADFADLVAQRKLLVGFNHLRFDNSVVRHQGFNLDEGEHYDILIESWRASGLSTDKFTSAHKGFKLDDFAMSNLGVGKTGNGALAPVWWQTGMKSRCVNYCLSDVMITTELFYRILETGQLIHPQNQLRLLEFRKPFGEITGILSPSGGTGNSALKEAGGRVIAETGREIKNFKRGLVPEIQPGLLPGIPDKVIGYHREVKPEGAPKSPDVNREVKENPRVD